MYPPRLVRGHSDIHVLVVASDNLEEKPSLFQHNLFLISRRCVDVSHALRTSRVHQTFVPDLASPDDFQPLCGESHRAPLARLHVRDLHRTITDGAHAVKHSVDRDEVLGRGDFFRSILHCLSRVFS